MDVPVDRNLLSSPFQARLFERNWWHGQLASLGDQPPSVFLHEREDLSSPLVEVVEMRLRAPDGQRLAGLRARRRYGPPAQTTVVRAIGPSEALEPDPAQIEAGNFEVVVQLPAHHSLRQRVLDLILALRFAESDHQCRSGCVQLLPTPVDEVAIARRLYEDGLGSLVRPARPLGDGSGLGTLPSA